MFRQLKLYIILNVNCLFASYSLVLWPCFILYDHILYKKFSFSLNLSPLLISAHFLFDVILLSKYLQVFICFNVMSPFLMCLLPVINNTCIAIFQCLFPIIQFQTSLVPINTVLEMVVLVTAPNYQPRVYTLNFQQHQISKSVHLSVSRFNSYQCQMSNC